jgi:hypothetical protein
MVIGFDILELVLTSYTAPTTPPTDVVEKMTNEHNGKAMNSILCGLS